MRLALAFLVLIGSLVAAGCGDNGAAATQDAIKSQKAAEQGKDKSGQD